MSRNVILGGAVYIGATAATYLYLKRGDNSSSSCHCSKLSDPRGIFDKNAEIYDAKIDLDETLMGVKLLRRFLIKKAQGDVLEVAAGTGRNLSYYKASKARSLTLTDSSREMLMRAYEKHTSDAKHGSSSFPVTFALADAQHLCAAQSPGNTDSIDSKKDDAKFGPALRSKKTFSSHSCFDTVVSTFGLCSCSDPVKALKVSFLH